MKPIRLFISDIDGTLFTTPEQYARDGGVSDRDLAAFRELEAAGIRVGIATGRNDRFLTTFARHRDLLLPTVGFNGGCVWAQGKILSQSPFAWGDVRRVMEDFPDLAYAFMGNTARSATLCWRKEDVQRNQAMRDAGRDLGWGPIYPGTLEEYLEDPKREPLCHMVFNLHSSEELPGCRDRINARYRGLPSGLRVVATSKASLAFVHKGLSKGLGLEALAGHYGLTMDQVAVVGDGENDLEMFRAAGRSFCMSSAPENIRREADTVVSSVAEAARLVMEQNKTSQT